MRNSIKTMESHCSNKLVLSRTIYNPYCNNNFKKFVRRNMPFRAMCRMRYNHLIKSNGHANLMRRAKLVDYTLKLNAYKEKDY